MGPMGAFWPLEGGERKLSTPDSSRVLQLFMGGGVGKGNKLD